MDIFDFEELISDMLGITDEQREDPELVERMFFNHFEFDMNLGFIFAKALLPHTITVQSAMLDKKYHAFVSKQQPVMLMKIEADPDK